MGTWGVGADSRAAVKQPQAPARRGPQALAAAHRTESVAIPRIPGTVAIPQCQAGTNGLVPEDELKASSLPRPPERLASEDLPRPPEPQPEKIAVDPAVFVGH